MSMCTLTSVRMWQVATGHNCNFQSVVVILNHLAGGVHCCLVCLVGLLFIFSFVCRKIPKCLCSFLTCYRSEKPHKNVTTSAWLAAGHRKIMGALMPHDVIFHPRQMTVMIYLCCRLHIVAIQNLYKKRISQDCAKATTVE